MALTQLLRGGNVSVQQDLPDERNKLRIELHWAGDNGQTPSVDAIAFCLTAAGKVRKESDMIFYNNRLSENTALVMGEGEGDPRGQYCQPFYLSTDKISDEIQRVVFSVVVDAGAGGVLRVGQLSNLKFCVRGGTSGSEFVRCDLAMPDAVETALIMGEVYRRNGEWKVKSVGQGYGAGLSAMAEGYGVAVASGAQAISPGTSAGGGGPQNPTVAGKASSPSIKVDPPPDGFGEIHVELTWGQIGAPSQPPPQRRGLFGGILGGSQTPKPVDLDLCCLYELADGYRGIVQALGNHYGAFNSAPFVELMGDERRAESAQVVRRELLRINGRFWKEVRRVLVFAMIFEGVPDWSKAQGKATIRVPDQVPVSVRLNQSTSGDRACSVAMIENEGGKLVLHKRIETFKNPRELDRFYGWGLQWTAGMKD